jgi:peptide deformylase
VKDPEVLPILQYPDKILNTRAEAVADLQSPDLQTLIDNMFYTMLKSGGIGLSANQINSLLRVFVIDTTSYKGGIRTAMINPIITNTQGEITMTEGCLSFKDQEVKCRVRRAEKIWITYYDHHLQRHEDRHFDHITARCILHEYDHIQGVTMVEVGTKEEDAK